MPELAQIHGSEQTLPIPPHLAVRGLIKLWYAALFCFIVIRSYLTSPYRTARDPSQVSLYLAA
jgi:hypothetical protein